jgi:predicted MFS family arabinose efflux permease
MHHSPTLRPRYQIISALGVVMIFSWGSTYYLMAVLAAPIAADTGWSLNAITGALSAGLLGAALISPRVGRLIAQWGGRPVMALGLIGLALGLALLALAQALWVFWAGWLVLGLGMAATLYDPAFATLGRIYGAQARGAITQLTLWGGFASTVCWPLSALMLEFWGWRGVALAYAGLHLCVTLPLIWLVLPRESGGTVHSPAKPAPAAQPSLSPREQRQYLLMAALLVVNGLVVVNVSVWLFKLLQAQGISLAQAVALGALIGPAQVGARLIEMAARERHHPIWTMIASCGAIAVGLVLLALGWQLPALALILYGGGNGLFSIARGSLPLALFGPERFAVLMGRLARPALIAQAIAPMAGAFSISALGAGVTLYLLALLGVGNLALTAAMWHMRRTEPY